MSKKITLNNVRNFILGYGNFVRNKLNILPKHQQEQVYYRMSLCKDDCAKMKYCKECGCNFPGRIFTPQTCNKNRFPDFMEEEEWKEFKIKNNIE